MKIKHSILGNKYIEAADKEENPQLDLADELQANLDDDFEYILAGIEKLKRENKLSEAIAIMESLSDALNIAISDISDNFSDISDNPDED